MSNQEKFLSWLEGYLDAMTNAAINKISSEEIIQAIQKKLKELKEEITTTNKNILHD